MEIKITVNVSGNEPVEIKVDIPEKGESKASNPEPILSEYAVRFDETSCHWRKNARWNKEFLIRQQKFANEKLKHRGYLFLNEVYDMLGVPRTAIGQVVGWVYDEDNPVGDNHVDFDIYAGRNVAFVNEWETRVLLDFNVDGDILKYL